LTGAKSELGGEIERIVQHCLREGATLSIAGEADRLSQRYPTVSKRLLWDLLIAAAFAVNLPIEMLDAEASCRDPAQSAAA
jgi:hypothetical protein